MIAGLKVSAPAQHWQTCNLQRFLPLVAFQTASHTFSHCVCIQLNINYTVNTVSPLLILQPFLHFTYVTTNSRTFLSLYLRQVHSPTLPSLYLRHSSFSNPSVASPTSQLILQPIFRFSYVTGSSLTSPGEPPMI